MTVTCCNHVPPAATRSCHGRTTITALAAGAPAHHVQIVRIEFDARCSLGFLVTRRHIHRTSFVPLSTLPGRTHLRSRTADNTTCHGCHLWLVQKRSPSPVHKPRINSLHLFATRELCHNFQASSQNYGGVWCSL